MEIKIDDRTYQIPDACPTEVPRKRVMRRHLRAHGAESFLTSKALSPFAACVWDNLAREGAEVVSPIANADVKVTGDSSLPSDVPVSRPTGPEASDSGDHEGITPDKAIPPV